MDLGGRPLRVFFDIEEVFIMTPAAITHSNNMNERRVLLNFVEYGTADSLVIQGPPDWYMAPKGWYMLGVLDDNGVPSIMKWLQVTDEGEHIVANGETHIFAGTCTLDRDVTVEAGGHLIVAEKTVVEAKDPDGGSDGPEIIVRGTITADGGTAPSNKIRFTYDADDSTAWTGLTFDLLGQARAGYGYWLAEEPISQLKNVEIDAADIGIRIAGKTAPNLEQVSFSAIATGHDILLDSTDVFVPAGWDNVAGSGQGLGTPRGLWDLDGHSTSSLETPRRPVRTRVDTTRARWI